MLHDERLQIELDEVTVAELLEIYLSKNKSAVIGVMSGDFAGVVVIDRGRITHAQFNNLEGAEALLSILACRSGTLTSVAGSARVRPTLEVNCELLLRTLAEPSPARQLEILQHLPEFDPRRARTAPLPATPRAPEPWSSEDLELRHVEPDRDFSTPSKLTQRRNKVHALIAQGVKEFNAAHFDEAKRCWGIALRLDPDNEIARHHLAAVSRRLHADH